MILKYDGSFEGFLSLVYEVYYKKLKPNEIIKSEPKTLVLDEIYEIQTNSKHAIKVLNSIKNSFDKKSYELIINIFLCDTKDFEIDLLSYVIIGFKDKNELYNINNTCVFSLQQLQKELFHNYHKMSGFLRFIELDDGTLYAKLENQFNLVHLLARHFLKRLNNQKFIIHDINRKIAFIKNEQFKGIQNIASFEEPNIGENEELFSKLWCRFFEAVSIDTRKNEKCQRNSMPLHYRTFMTEFINT